MSKSSVIAYKARNLFYVKPWYY